MKKLNFIAATTLGLASILCSGLASAQSFLDFDQPSVRAKTTETSQLQEPGLHQPLRQNLAALEAGQFLLDSIQIRDERARTPDFEAMADAGFYESEGAAVMEGQAKTGKLASTWNN